MGATNGSAYFADPDVGRAYNGAVRNATDEYGHDGYNGTISTSSGYFIAHRVPVSAAQARAMEDAAWNREDSDEGVPSINGHTLTKWESWAAIPIADESSFSTRIKKVTLTDKVSAWGYGGASIEKAVKAKLTLAAGETVVEVKIIDDKPVWKPVVSTPEGERTIVYQVITRNQIVVAEAPTIAAARKLALELAKGHGKPKTGYDGKPVRSYDSNEPVTYLVKGVVRRGQGHPLLEVSTAIVSRKTTVEVKITKSKGTPKTKGWYFFGMAAI